jgi:ABC-type xylose transport system permease subunit|tara:strand:- start:142 stop:618 length:477 start_codon:yes stop_codon:yes gene_type:complete
MSRRAPANPKAGLAGPPGSDGYYYRTAAKGPAVGPLTRAEFNRRRANGTIKEGMSCWRTSMGAAFKITVKSRYQRAKVCALDACQHGVSMCMLICTTCSTALVFLLPDWGKIAKKEGRGTIIFIVVLLFFTAIMVVATVRKVFGRWRTSASETFTSEV